MQHLGNPLCYNLNEANVRFRCYDFGTIAYLTQVKSEIFSIRGIALSYSVHTKTTILFKWIHSTRLIFATYLHY
jgi:hypothetical protein